MWQRWPQWGPHSTLLVDDDPIKCARSPPLYISPMSPLCFPHIPPISPHISPMSPHISPYLPVSPRCERNPPHTAIHPAKWRALLPPDGSELELAPHGALATYLEALHAAPDTQARLRPIDRRSDRPIAGYRLLRGSHAIDLSRAPRAHTQAHVAANIYVPPGAAGAGAAAEDGEHSDHD